MVQPEDVERYIGEGMACDYVAVKGDGHHFEAVVVSSLFQGKTRVQQHQVVYAALGDRMREEIHALAIKTYTPEQWSAVEEK